MASPNLLDIAKANNSDGQVGLIEQSIQAHPEITLGAARTIPGTMYKTLVRTAMGRTTGSFRSANAGSTAIKNVYENRIVETYILEARFEADKAVADAYIDGAQSYIALEAGGILEGEMRGICSQFYYGNGLASAAPNNASGFPGLLDSYDATNMVIDAGGTTASTGSSVWLVKFGPKWVQWVWGGGGSALQFSPVRIESLIDPNDTGTPPTKKLDGYVHTLLAYPGLQIGSPNAAVRIKKLTADSGKGLTDALITQALAKFPTGIQPDVCLMTRRSLQQLQASRTTYSPTGQPAPFPTGIVGISGAEIPIAVTDAILNTESLTL